MHVRSAWTWLGLASLLASLVAIPSVVSAADDVGFDGYIQSGTCERPTDSLRVKLESEDSHDVEPYVAIGPNGKPVTLGYYGTPGAPGFSVDAIYTSARFSLVITESGDAVACGDILRPEADRYAEVGVALVQLLPVESSDVQGVAVMQRTSLQRELDITPTRVRIILTIDAVEVPAEPTAGYDGYVQSGQCKSPTDDLRTNLKSRRDHDVSPFEAELPGSVDPVTVSYSGAPGLPGFGIAAAYTDEDFSLVITDTRTGDPVACGDILEPDDDKFIEAGVALVELRPIDDSEVQGYALMTRTSLQRELDITPTRVRVVLFAPPITGQ